MESFSETIDPAPSVRRSLTYCLDGQTSVRQVLCATCELQAQRGIVNPSRAKDEHWTEGSSCSSNGTLEARAREKKRAVPRRKGTLALLASRTAPFLAMRYPHHIVQLLNM